MRPVRKYILIQITLAASILIGLSLLGYFIFIGLKTFSDKDRIVTVKGLAEMNMKATSSSIGISFSFSGDTLQNVIEKCESKKQIIIDYLNSSKIQFDDIQIQNIDVTDKQKYYKTKWENGKQVKVKINRYITNQKLSISINHVEITEDISSKIELDLISKDLTSKIQTNYRFPPLNTIKPKLIAESTKNARISGEQFANDSKAKLGKIKTASQGQISIAGRYYYDNGITETPKEPYFQKARVVSTIVFFLE